jgi:hypothetical protein
MSLGLQNYKEFLMVSTHPVQLYWFHGVRRSPSSRFLPLLSAEELEKSILNMVHECTIFTMSAKIFPGSMVGLNCLHVSDIFNSGFFPRSHHKNAVSLGKEPSLLACHFPGVLHHFDRTHWSTEMLCLACF